MPARLVEGLKDRSAMTGEGLAKVRVLSLTLCSTADCHSDDDRAKVNAMVQAMLEMGIGPVPDRLAARWFNDDFSAAKPDVTAWRGQQVIDRPADIFLNLFDIYAETEMAPWLHKIQAPAQVVTGALDGGCIPRLNGLIAAAMPGAELVILPELKHAIFIEATERVLPHVRQILPDRGRGARQPVSAIAGDSLTV